MVSVQLADKTKVTMESDCSVVQLQPFPVFPNVFLVGYLLVSIVASVAFGAVVGKAAGWLSVKMSCICAGMRCCPSQNPKPTRANAEEDNKPIAIQRTE